MWLVYLLDALMAAKHFYAPAAKSAHSAKKIPVGQTNRQIQITANKPSEYAEWLPMHGSDKQATIYNTSDWSKEKFPMDLRI